MSTAVEILPEKLEAAEAALEALAEMITGIRPPAWQGEGEGETADVLAELTEACSGLGEALSAVCRDTAARIRTVRITITETDARLAGE